MKKIGFVVPYFGKLPNNFQIWLNSCKKNSTIDWLIFTDDRGEYIYPENCVVTYIEFDQLLDKIKSCFDFPLALDSAYKLTDFKVSYGEVFQEHLQGYDFWGYCDIDLIFGDIRKFISDEILERYDKILTRGHFTLLRNNKKINEFYRKSINGIESYKEVFSNPNHYYFDEWGENGINQIFNAYEVKMYDEIVFHDIFHRKYNFYPSQLMTRSDYKNRNIYLWDRGTLYRLYLDEQGNLVKEEIMYVHFLRRKMKTVYDAKHPDKILITPNEFRSIDREWDENDSIKYLKRNLFNLDHLKFYIRQFKRKYKL